MEGEARLRSARESTAIRGIAEALGADSDLYLVGGTVRDCLSNHEPHDFDLASKLDPQTATDRLNAAGLRVIETGLKHGTVTVLADGRSVELTTFRIPGPHHQNYDHQNRYANDIGTDLGGRDFTINAVAYSVASCELCDPYQGQADLNAGVLRAVGDATMRFEEDPLRILRMIRFGPAAGRAVDPATWEAARTRVATISSVSVERIRSELERIILSPHAGAGLHAIEQVGLLALVLPELVPSVGFAQNDFHIHDVFEHTIWVLDRAPQERLVRLAALFHDAGKPATLSTDDQGRRHFYRHEELSETLARTAMERLKFSHADIADVAVLVRLHMRPLNCGAPGVRRLMRDLGTLLPEWKKLKLADAPPLTPVEEIAQAMTGIEELIAIEDARVIGSVHSGLAIDGNDLIKIGIPPGPQMGMILKALVDEVLEEPERNQAEALLTRASQLATEISSND